MQTFDALPIILVETITSEGTLIASTGKGRSLEQRLVSAVFEAIERRVMLEAKPDIVSPLHVLNQLAVAPERSEYPLDCGHVFASLSDPLEWSWGMPASGGDARLVHRPTWRGVGLYSASTNGAAAGLTSYQARSSALLELAERDAVLLHWHARAPAPRLPSVPAVCMPLLDWLGEHGFSVTLYVCTVGVPIPIVFAAAQAQRAHAGFAFGGMVAGSAAAATYEAASLAAVLEIVQAIEAALFTMIRDGSLARFEPTIARYLCDDSRSAFAFLDGHVETQVHPELFEGRSLASNLAAAFMIEGLRPLVIDRCTATTQVQVSEATATGVQRMTLSCAAPRSRRLLDLAQRTGRGINADPHPIA